MLISANVHVHTAHYSYTCTCILVNIVTREKKNIFKGRFM